MVKKIGIVSLSSGILGQSYVSHELKIGEKRLTEYGIQFEYVGNSLKGIEYLKNNPDKRADDLIKAFSDNSIDMILCAIGGDDTHRLLPYLLEDDRLKKVVNNKIFLGFSDTTINHLMLNKLGIKTFYGQAYLPDICELSDKMLTYTEKYFTELITTGKIEKITPSDIWYMERIDFSEKSIGIDRISYKNHGFELLQGNSKFSGQILGGCLETIYLVTQDIVIQ